MEEILGTAVHQALSCRPCRPGPDLDQRGARRLRHPVATPHSAREWGRPRRWFCSALSGAPTPPVQRLSWSTAQEQRGSAGTQISAPAAQLVSG